MASPVSFLGGFNAQTARFKNLNSVMNDLSRQFATQKKADNFSGLGFDALSVQRYRMDKSRLESYAANIDTAITRVQLMSDSMTRAADIGREVLGSLYSQIRSSEVDMDTVRNIAKQNLQLLQDITNLEIDGRYLFAGSNTGASPVTNLNAAAATAQTQANDWLAGTVTTAQLLNTLNTQAPTALGFDSALSAAGTVSIRIDTNTEVDYTSIASTNGMKEIMAALSIISQLDIPDPSTDVATSADFNDLLDGIVDLSQRGVKKIDDANAKLSGKFNLITTVQENHTEDIGLFETLISKKENVDTAEIATKIQALQTQLTGSYQVASYISQLSLANFLS